MVFPVSRRDRSNTFCVKWSKGIRWFMVVKTPILIEQLDPTLDVSEVLAAFQNEPFVLLLDSAGHHRLRDSRYSFLTADPIDVERIDRVSYGDQPFTRLKQWQQFFFAPDALDLPPFYGGIAGLLSYELGQAFEVVPQPARDDFRTPALLAGLFDWAIVWDHLRNAVTLYVLPLRGSSPEVVQQRCNWVREHLRDDHQSASQLGSLRKISVEQRSGFALPFYPKVESCFSAEAYIAAVERVIEYIRAGDIFQANLAQQLTAFWEHTAVDLYRRVREQNPAPFGGFLQAKDFAVVSASPERFLRVTDGCFVETRPIKGTRRRHQSPIADLFTGDELSASEKDRAENVMIVDLLRNDLSRVCRPGSVRVTGLCEVEVFQTVQHLVSTVVGELYGGMDVWDLLAAAFPGGSITGAPKIRAMEIIAESEPVVRGAYCGSLFYLGPNGDLDSSILIRTFTLKDGRLQFPVGGGIVADSTPWGEYRETLHKAAGMLQAIGM